MNIAEIDQPVKAISAAKLDEWVHIPTPGDHYSPRTGSAVITVIHQMNRWHLAAGGKARVLVANGTWDGYDDGARTEIPFRRLGTPSKFAKVFDRSISCLVGQRPLSGRPYIDAAHALGRDFDGIVFVHNEPSGVEPIARRCPSARVCLWVHNELFRTYTPRQARRVVEHSHRVICVSEFIARGVRAKAGDNPKIVVVLNGVDTEKFVPADPAPRNDPPVILFLGRMIPEKGPDLLLKAAIELQRQGVKFKLRMVGSNNFNAADALTPYERELRQLGAALGNNVEFLPFRPREEVVSEYQRADILCVPSNWDDPCPLALSEGMACGLPIVASRRGGISEAASDAAVYFNAANGKELPVRLTELLSNREKRNVYSILARKRALQISWELIQEETRAAIM